MAVFKEVAWKWKRFGGLLLIPDAALNVIEKDFSADVEHFKALILYWILKCPYASRRFLIWDRLCSPRSMSVKGQTAPPHWSARNGGVATY